MSKRFIKWWGKEINWKYWVFYNLEINKDDFNLLPTDSKWNVRMVMSAMKTPAKYLTHYIVLNEREPSEPKEQNEAQRATKDDIDMPW